MIAPCLRLLLLHVKVTQPNRICSPAIVKAEPGNCSGIRSQNALGRFRFNPQKVIGLSADRLANAVAVLGSPLEGS